MAIRTTDGTQYKRTPNVGDMYPTATGFQREVATYTATGGETSINLALLSPALSYIPGRNQLSIKRSSGGSLMVGLDFTETSSTTVGFPDPLIAGEVVQLTKEFTVTGVMAVEPRPDCYTATATVGQTLVTADFSWPYNLNPAKAVGGVSVYLNGVLQTRNVDFTEVSLSAANTNQILFADPLLGGENIILLPTYQAIDQSAAASTYYGQAYSNVQSMLQAGTQGFVDQSERIAVPNTTIVGRATIVNLANDLRASLGIDRVMTQSIVQLQNEFGPNGEPVYAAINDDRGLIRFVGAWTNSNTVVGPAAYGDPNAYVEITFYGTGLNVLSFSYSDARSIVASVDGGAESANLYPGSSYSTVIRDRNYGPNQIFPVPNISGLGVHTVKIKCAAIAFYCEGFEILNSNASGLVNINSGVGYLNGQKYTKIAATSVSYSTGVTGVRGGRIVRYLNADGSVGQAFTAVNAAPAYLTNANHTNEDVARPYHCREFGCGKTDDFSSLPSTTGNSAAFTLDDGTTTLGASLVSSEFSTFPSGIYLRVVNSFITFTFIGTGLDVMRADSANSSGTDTIQFWVDGAAIGTSSITSTAMRKVSVVSGLPYGTHTVKILCTAQSAAASGIGRFIVYQPKKPTIPATALELCDYNVMADYVGAASGDPLVLGAGVLRKQNTREFIYVGTWGGPALDTVNPSGFSIYSNTGASYCQYTYFGYGVEINAYVDTAAVNFTVSIDGSSNLVGSTLIQPSTGLTWNAATGTVTGTSSAGGRLRIKIPYSTLGVHTVKKTHNSGHFIYMMALDIVTPIHSYKSNLYADLQNTLPVGSNSLMDSRKTSMIKEALPAQKSWSQAIGVTTPATTSATSFVPMPDLSVTIKTNGGPLKITGDACVISPATAGVYLRYGIYVNGVQISQTRILYNPVAATTSLSPTWDLIYPVSAGTHKVDVYWASSGATFTMYVDGNNGRILTVQEL